jgi:hypothetical protein
MSPTKEKRPLPEERSFLEKLRPCPECGGRHLLLSRSHHYEIEVFDDPEEPAYTTLAREEASDVRCANPACSATVLAEDDLSETDADFVHDEL